MVGPNVPLSATDYVCVLKCKLGEIQATQGASKDRFVPLIEALSADHATSLERAAGHNDVIWVQPLNLDGLDDVAWGAEVSDLFDRLRVANVQAVPAVTIGETPEVLAATAAAIAADGRGLVLRIDAEDVLMTPPADLRAEIDAIVLATGASHSSIDLILDASFVRDSVAARIATVDSARTALPYEPQWRSFVIALSAFPAPYGTHIAKNAVSLIPREDRDAFVTLAARNTGRALTYADFAVGQPTYSGAPFPAIPNIKYTSTHAWVIHRADTVRDPSPQYIALAGDLVASAHFRSASFSPGDSYLNDVANGSDGPGNATSYVKVAVSHHVHHVLDRLSTHGEP